MYVVEMHGQLYGPFDYGDDAYAWGDLNCDPDDRPGKRYLVRNVNTPHPATNTEDKAA